MDDRERGVYQKFIVERTDGASKPGKKHADCFYFVIDTDHDKHGVAALRAYADSCAAEYPALAEDLRQVAQDMATRLLGQPPEGSNAK